MAFIPVPDTSMATLHFQDVNAVVAIQRFFCANDDPPTETSLSEIADAIYDWWVAQGSLSVVEEWSLTGITVRAMNEAEGLEFEDTNAYPVVGQVPSALPPANQVSYTVTWNTGLVGRSARGRTYGVGLDNAWHNGVRLLDTTQAALQSEWELFLTALETAGHALQVVSFQEGGVFRTEGRPLPVVSGTVRFPLATQRRRLA